MKRMKRMRADDRVVFARFLLLHTVDFVDSALVETNEEIKQFNLICTANSLGGWKCGWRRLTRNMRRMPKLARQMDKFYQRQDDVEVMLEVMLEARDGIIAKLREGLITLTTREDSSELEKKVTDQTHAVIYLRNRECRGGRGCRLLGRLQRRRRSGRHGQRRRHRVR